MKYKMSNGKAPDGTFPGIIFRCLNPRWPSFSPKPLCGLIQHDGFAIDEELCKAQLCWLCINLHIVWDKWLANGKHYYMGSIYLLICTE